MPRANTEEPHALPHALPHKEHLLRPGGRPGRTCVGAGLVACRANCSARLPHALPRALPRARSAAHLFGRLLCRRKLAAKYAKLNRPDAEAKVYDSLQLGVYCNDTTRPDEGDLPVVFPPPALADGLPAAPPAGAVYADAGEGSDSTGTGSAASPYASLPKALAVAAAKPLGSRTVVLRAGTFFLKETVQVPVVAGLSVQAMAGEEVWLSGGTLLSAISWVEHDLSDGMNIYKADLSAFGLTAIDGLRVDGRRVSLTWH